MQPHLNFTGLLGKRLHLGVTGSVAAFKSLELLRMWRSGGLTVGCTLTAAAQRFVAPLSFRALGASPVYERMFADDSEEPDDLFGHLEPGQHADAFVIAPATANCLAKLASGIADDMLSCQALAFPGALVIAPAMNPRLWAAQATQENWGRLSLRGHRLIEPVSGPTACGEEGKGRLAELEHIYLYGLREVCPKDMAGARALVTLGPTREFWDAVRFWSNPSTGIMGASLAVAAWLRGASVTAVCGPAAPWLPPDITRHDVVSAHDMYRVCADLWPGMDIGCFTAAVADFSPWPFGDEKFKKQSAHDGLTIEFTPNPDILKTLAEAKSERQKIIGFAAETSATLIEARRKLAAKKAHLLVANNIGLPGAGFGSATNEVFVLDCRGREERWPVLPKTEVAWRIWDWLSQL